MSEANRSFPIILRSVIILRLAPSDYSQETSACKQAYVSLQTNLSYKLQVMSDTQNQLDKIREQNKARQEKFYKSNKETINAKRRELYKLKRESLKTEK